MTEDFSVNEREEPAPAITDAQCLAAMRECAAQKGESHEAMWSQMDAQVRAEVLGEWRAILECAGVAGRSPAEVPPNWPDAQRLNWLEGTGESYCNRDRIDRFGAEWLSFDSEAALDANDPTGTHKNIRDAIDAAAGSAAEVPPNEILELCNLVLGGFNEDGDYNGDTKYILALCAAVWRSAQQ